MIGAEGIANSKWMVEGQWIEYAKEFGAMCFYLEHRFYGKSHPTSYVGQIDKNAKGKVILEIYVTYHEYLQGS